MASSLRIRLRFRLLLAATICLLAILISSPENQHLLFVGVLLLVLAGVNTLPQQHPMFLPVLLMGITTLLLKGLALISVVPYHIGNLAMGALYVVLFTALIHRLTRERPVTGELLYGLMAIYMQIALLFALIYEIIEKLSPGAFAASSGISILGMDDFTYFSLITLTTVGYGDIYPIHPLARLLVTLEAVTGVLFIGLSMARSLMLISEDDDSDLPR